MQRKSQSRGVVKRRRKNAPSKEVKENFYMLVALHEASNEVKKSAIRNASKEFLVALTEMVKNLVRGNVPLSNLEYSKLASHAQELTELSGKTTLTRKRELLQKGGFLGALIGPLISTLGPLLGGVVKSILPSR